MYCRQNTTNTCTAVPPSIHSQSLECGGLRLRPRGLFERRSRSRPRASIAAWLRERPGDRRVALILPLRLILLLLILDFGRAINYWIDSTHLASEGARLAAVDKAPGGNLQAHIKNQADTEELRTGGSVGVAAPGLEVSICYPEGRAVGNPVKVTVSADYNWLPFLNSEFGLTQTAITGSATHRIERVTGAVTRGARVLMRPLRNTSAGRKTAASSS